MAEWEDLEGDPRWWKGERWNSWTSMDIKKISRWTKSQCCRSAASCRAAVQNDNVQSAECRVWSLLLARLGTGIGTPRPLCGLRTCKTGDLGLELLIGSSSKSLGGSLALNLTSTVTKSLPHSELQSWLDPCHPCPIQMRQHQGPTFSQSTPQDRASNWSLLGGSSWQLPSRHRRHFPFSILSGSSNYQFLSNPI